MGSIVIQRMFTYVPVACCVFLVRTSQSIHSNIGSDLMSIYGSYSQIIYARVSKYEKRKTGFSEFVRQVGTSKGLRLIESFLMSLSEKIIC